MKIKLAESKLKQIVTESVNKVLKKSAWYRDSKHLEIVYYAANQIVEKLE